MRETLLAVQLVVLAIQLAGMVTVINARNGSPLYLLAKAAAMPLLATNLAIGFTILLMTH